MSTVYIANRGRPPVVQVSRILKDNSQYAFFALGAVWLATAVTAGPLALWPVAALVASGALLRLRPEERVTWALSKSSAFFRFVVAGYQVYASMGLLSGAFAGVATASLALFGVFAAVHLLLLWPGKAKPEIA